jgi:hypothetical protein
MSSSWTWLRIRHVSMYAAALVIVLALHAVAGTTEKNAGLQGPSFTGAAKTVNATESKDITQAPNSADAKAPTESEKSSKTEKQPDVVKSDDSTAEAKKESGAAQPDKKTDSSATEKKPDTARSDKGADVPKTANDSASAAKPRPAKVEKEAKTDAASAKSAVGGEPLASGMIKLLQEEIFAGIRRRGVSDRFSRF